MKHIDPPHSQEYLPVFEPENRIITDIVDRKTVHEKGLHHGHVNVWIPGMRDGTVYKQIKTKSHGRADATIGGHIDYMREHFTEIMGRDIVELGPQTAVKEGGEETGIVFSQDEIMPLGIISETWGHRRPESKSWNNGVVIAYMLNRRVALNEILNNPLREDGLDFEEVDIETLLQLGQKDIEKYLGKLVGETYKEIFIKLKEQLRQI